MSEGYTPAWEGLFSRMEQPALIVQDETIKYQNSAAERLLRGAEPVLAECMLPETLETYRSFDGEGSLLLTMRLGEAVHSFTVYRENGADVFLASMLSSEQSYHILERTAQSIRRAVHEIYDAQDALLSNLENDGAVKKPAARINKTVCRLERLAGNLADYSALRANERKGRFERVDLVNNVRFLCGRVQDMFREYKITFSSEEKNMMGQVDMALMDRAILNLVTNAIRAMRPGGTLTVRLIRLDKSRAALRVEDDGEGMEPSVISGALCAAAQPVSLDPRFGVGLGLSLCMEIARLHGGTLLLQSEPGKGVSAMLSFSLALPGDTEKNTLRFSAGGLDPFLVEISELLPASLFYDI